LLLPSFSQPPSLGRAAPLPCSGASSCVASKGADPRRVDSRDTDAPLGFGLQIDDSRVVSRCKIAIARGVGAKHFVVVA
jgi:hypothetical protein